MLQKLGADAIGMLTVLEVIQARARPGGRRIFVPNELGSRNFDNQTQSRQIGKAAVADFARLLQTELSM